MKHSLTFGSQLNIYCPNNDYKFDQIPILHPCEAVACESKPKGVQTQRRRVFLTTKPAHCEAKKGWWTLGDLNPRPSGCKPDALPTELSALVARAVGHSLLSLHLCETANQTQSMVASRSGPTPTLVQGTPTKASSLAM